jgi:HSP20 family protein
MSEELSVTKAGFDFWDHMARVLYKQRKFFMDARGQAHMETEPWEPPCEIVETSGLYIARIELPGIDKKLVTLTLENNKTLWVRGQKYRPGERPLGSVTPPPQENEDGTLVEPEIQVPLFSDIIYGFWAKKLELPGDVAVDGIRASMENGVLSIDLPKLKVHTSTIIPVE